MATRKASTKKAKTAFVCSECGAESPRWEGRGSQCHQWNTMQEIVLEPATTTGVTNRYESLAGASPVQSLADVQARELPRQPTGLSELDRALGGGLVDGGVILIGGDPGVGKSTLLLQAMSALASGVGLGARGSPSAAP